MVYTYLPAVNYNLNLGVIKEGLLVGGIFRCLGGLSWLILLSLSVCKIPQKIFDQSTSFLAGTFPLTIENMIRF